MAIDLTIICFGAFILLFVVLIIYGMIIKSKRKKLIKSLKAGGAPLAGGPALVQGAVDDPAVALPSTGEKCAFYAVHVFSKELSSKKSLGSAEMTGFDVMDCSGDFSVKSSKDGKDYVVGVSEYMDSMKPAVGAMMDMGIKMAMGRYSKNPAMQDYITENKFAPTIKSMLMIVFGMRDYESKSESKTSVLFYSSMSEKIKVGKVQSTIDTSIKEYTIGKDVPSGVTKVLTDKKVLGTQLAKDGAGIYVIEAYIPLGKEVYAVGTYTTEGGKDMLAMKDTITSLTISYEDPETSKLI